MTHSEITAAPRFRDLLEKGATRDSEKVYKDVKSLHKRLYSSCVHAFASSRHGVEWDPSLCLARPRRPVSSGRSDLT